MSRDDLKTRLLTRLAPVVRGRGSARLGVWGEVGVGKTHLTREVLRGLSCRTVSVGAGAGLARIAGQVGLKGELKAQEAGRQAKQLAALLAESAPLVLHLDDFQELEPERLELWAALAKSVEAVRGVGLVVSGRLRPPDPFESERLPPLTRVELRRLLAEAASADLPEPALAWLEEQSAGNPHAGLEYFRWLQRQGALWNDGQRWRWRAPAEAAVPTSLQGAVAQALRPALASPEEQQVLAARALLPEGASFEVWAGVAGLPPGVFERARAELERQSLLCGDRFSHPLLAQAVRAGLSPARRRELAARAVPRLLCGPDARLVMGAAGLVGEAGYAPAEALSALLEAAERLKRLDRPGEAAQVLGKAADLATGGEQARLALEAAEGLRQTDPAEALRLSRLAARLAPTPEALLLQAELLVQGGQPQAVEPLLWQLSPHELQTRWIPRLIGLRVQQTRFDEALDLWRRNPQLHPQAPALTRRDVAWALMQFGELGEAQGLLETALEGRITPRERALLLGAQAYLEILKGRPLVAAQLASAAIALLGPDTPRDLARALEFRLMAREQLGRFAEAAADGEQALRLRERLGDEAGVAQGRASLAPVLIELARYEQAEELLLQSQAFYARAEAKEPLINCHCQLAYLYLEWPDGPGGALALRHAGAAALLAREGASPVNLNLALAHLAWAEARFGDPAQALDLADQAAQVAAGMGQPESVEFETFAKAIALEALGRKAEALEAYAEAARMLRQGGMAAAERFALEVDRLSGDRPSAERRLARFVQQGHLHAARLAERYFGLAAPPAPEGRPVELRVLGPVRVLKDGQPVRLHSGQARAFLAHLLEARMARRDEVSATELFDLLWAGTPEEKARVALKQLVYRLRAALGPGSVVRTPRGYALGDVTSDAEAFLQTHDLSLWRGPYLEDLSEATDLEEIGQAGPTGEPQTPGAGEVRAALYHTLRLGAQGLLESDSRLALRLGRILMQADPYSRPALTLVCRALHRLGNRRDLRKVYDQARLRLGEVGEVLPGSWQGFLRTA